MFIRMAAIGLLVFVAALLVLGAVAFLTTVATTVYTALLFSALVTVCAALPIITIYFTRVAFGAPASTVGPWYLYGYAGLVIVFSVLFLALILFGSLQL